MIRKCEQCESELVEETVIGFCDDECLFYYEFAEDKFFQAGVEAREEKKMTAMESAQKYIDSQKNL